MVRDKIKLSELQKLAKKSIREDIENYEKQRTKEIIETSRLTHKVKRALNEGKNLISKLENKEI